MNLGQVIDGELVREGRHIAKAPTKPAPAPAMGKVDHVVDMRSGGSLDTGRGERRPYGFGAESVLEILRKNGGWLTSAQVFEVADELEIGQVQSALARLRERLQVDRITRAGVHSYAIRGTAMPAGLPASDPPAKAAPAIPAMPPKGEQDRVTVYAVLTVLDQAKQPLTCREVRDMVGIEGERAAHLVSAILGYLQQRGSAKRVNEARPFSYLITDAGRARLKNSGRFKSR